MKKIALISAAVTSILFSSGCSTQYTLTMKAVVDPYDTSSLSPKLKAKKYERIMIMPPSGTKRGEFDSMIALCEKVFIKEGITPINGAITGRVVMQVPDESGKEKNETAQNLSDVERAFVMAKESGCDAILQIGKFESSPRALTRFFIADRKTRTPVFREVNEELYQSWSEHKYSFKSKWITFVGRLSDVETGEVLASINIVSAPNWNLPADYEAKISNGTYLLEHNYVYSSSYFNGTVWVYDEGAWAARAHDRAVKSILERVAANIKMK